LPYFLKIFVPSDLRTAAPRQQTAFFFLPSFLPALPKSAFGVGLKKFNHYRHSVNRAWNAPGG
jgi:hypothetical protein